MASVGSARAQDENNGEPLLTSPNGKMSRKRKMEERDENSLGEPEDFEWENSKENVMPLKRGRRVDDLNRALRTHESFQGKAKVDQEAKEMEACVREYTGADPLSMWVQYIKWIETKMPEDTRKKFTVLEKCTRELKTRDQYKNDVRYVRLWIQYADLVSNPKDIFKFLYVNKIGERVSLFYVGWAMVLESMANYAQAHKVFLKATQKKAQPEDLLDRKYKEFQRRMSRHWLKVGNADGNESSNDGSQRFALEDISTDGADIQRFGNSENFRQYAQAQAEKMQRANAHKPVFTVYEDPAGTEVDALPTSTNWKRLDTVRHQNKENDTAPARWNDGPLQPQQERAISTASSVSAQPAADPLQVFVDPEFTASTKSAPAGGERDHSLTLRQRLEGTSTEEEQLVRQPLKNFTSTTAADLAKPPRVTKPAKTAGERYMYVETSLKTNLGEELCFEELRARQYSTKVTIKHRPQSSGVANRFLAHPVEAPAKQTKARSQEPTSPLGMNMFAAPSPFVKRDAGDIAGVGTGGNGGTGGTTLDQAVQEDMTINTRLAMEDVNSMFCSPSREKKEPDVQATVWEVPEPVERKLHFSIFEDSIDSIALNPNDMSLRNDALDQVEKNSFQVFADDTAPQEQSSSFQVFADETQTNQQRTASKMSARKPLTSREDLARRSRLTNKDMIMKIQTDTKAAGDEESPTARHRKLYQIDHGNVTTKRVPEYVGRAAASNALSVSASTIQNQKAFASVDPYDAKARKAHFESASIKDFARTSLRLVHRHPFNTPMRWTTNRIRRKLKIPITFRLDRTIVVEAVGFLGSGGFAQVYSARVTGLDPTTRNLALKCEKREGTLMWELHITEKLRNHFGDENTCWRTLPIPRMIRLDIFKNGAILFMEKASAGTLHDLVNSYKKDRGHFPETLAVHYAIRMLYAVEFMHEANVLHGDIKPDNWLLTPMQRSNSSRKSNTGDEAESSTGDLHLIDFGRSIDLDLYPKGTTFHGTCHVKGFQPVEMLMKKPWTNQIDSFGLCATVYFLLFGEYMEVVKVTSPHGCVQFKPSKSFKRYWQVGMWASFFDKFLNVKSCENQPSLASSRRQFERLFQDNPHRQQELNELLASQDRMLSSRPRI